MTVAFEHATPRHVEAPFKRYDIVDRFGVVAPAEPASHLEIWCPVVADTTYQRVLDIAVRAPHPWSVRRDAEFGNTMLHVVYPGPFKSPLSFEIRYEVERFVRPHLGSSRSRAIATPWLFARTLEPEQYVDVNAKTRAIARDVVGGETDPLEQARLIYGHVTGKMTYNSAEQSWKGSTEHALVCSVGNCNDIHALFVSLCRSAGIPARFVLGQALEQPPEGGETCDLCGYHCWAEFFVSGMGWLPADASCACKYGKHGLFGELEMNHIAWSVGRDILFSPPQRAGRSLFFTGPYAEADGRAVAVDRRLSFSDLE